MKWKTQDLTLCAMLTGWLLAVPVLYVGINFLVMAVMQLIHWLAELFIFGYQGDGFGSFTLWCTPVVQLVRRLTADIAPRLEAALPAGDRTGVFPG